MISSYCHPIVNVYLDRQKFKTVLNFNDWLKSINTVCHKCLTNIQTGRELPDSMSLEECGVENGATLKLILAMRGGPINTRRVVISNTSGRNPSEHGSNETATSSHIEDIMLNNKDKLLDKIPKNGQVFKYVSIITMLRTKYYILFNYFFIFKIIKL